MASYSSFAAVYDALMNDFDYDTWARYYLWLLTKDGRKLRSVCDCACGTGSLTIPIAATGLKIVGSDLSEEMLTIAQEKARAEGLRIPFVKMDMCALEMPRAVDAVLCGCDGVNYLTTLERVRAFFTAAHTQLKKGGVLVFDISSPYKLGTVTGNGFFGEERDDIAYLWSNNYNEETRIIEMDLTFFKRREDGLYERFAETHVQRAHTPEELTQALRECGFDNIEIYGNMTKEAPKADELRIHFRAVAV